MSLLACPYCTKCVDTLIMCECEAAAYCSEACKASDFDSHSKTCEALEDITIDSIANQLLAIDDFRELLYVIANASNVQCDVSHYAHIVEDNGIAGNVYKCIVQPIDGNTLLREIHMCDDDDTAIYSVSRSTCEQVAEKSNIISVLSMKFPITLLCNDVVDIANNSTRCRMTNPDIDELSFINYRNDL